MVSFIREAGRFIPEVQATVIDMEGVDVEAARRLAAELSVKLRVRMLHVVG